MVTIAETAAQRWMVMVMREKLIDLLEEAGDKSLHQHIPLTSSMIADHLIANGVEIPVRCKDCKYWERWATTCGVADKGYCNCHEVDAMEQDDFCSYGERREGE